MAVRQSQARRSEIVRLAKTSGLASVEELSVIFGVTPSTIRRDLGQLTTEGLLARTYGGAIALNAHPEPSIRQRTLEGFDAKRAIAKWAATQVLPGETILLDAGTTVGAMGEFLRETERLTVITAGLTALEALADADTVRVECLGGTLRHLSQGFVGPLTESALARVSFDRAFLGADAVTADRGICEAELEQTRLKELMMERGSAVYVLAHAAKLGRRPFHAWAPLPPSVTVVTDSTATDAQLRPFADAGIVVVTV
ncbi:DeoR/GlpR family DNA-binding transcription regulator [Mycobacterium sp. AZCC_0083]|jgi:DeoR/GlpR family transcriptional regulator of sugar metabolism|uniref:DeoR/GlpR family DNA-binding transcription regulator n=1 Tax=Mycobacterium sp. AZCC_0083 TaxID=2735882 RepID=UPI00161B6619|nr:DeoR/GlpR family DNA-binding transcription regulator [Mycobacterium sp. AZCC_0083]MBB5162933.1 DeoR/GlpR family transcriptional regulator of sugar metabolism [Mycobacterium sp. AZCC_0083]